MAQDLRQVVRTELGGSASAIGQLGKPYLAFYLCHDTLQWVWDPASQNREGADRASSSIPRHLQTAGRPV